jgi:hypothetical protein
MNGGARRAARERRCHARACREAAPGDWEARPRGSRTEAARGWRRTGGGGEEASLQAREVRGASGEVDRGERLGRARVRERLRGCKDLDAKMKRLEGKKRKSWRRGCGRKIAREDS